MKTTVDLPDPLFRKAKATAAQRGISLKRFLTEAVEQKLVISTADSGPKAKPWIEVMATFPSIPREDLVRELINMVTNVVAPLGVEQGATAKDIPIGLSSPWATPLYPKCRTIPAGPGAFGAGQRWSSRPRPQALHDSTASPSIQIRLGTRHHIYELEYLAEIDTIIEEGRRRDLEMPSSTDRYE